MSNQSVNVGDELFLGGFSGSFLRRLLWLVVVLNGLLGAQSAWAHNFDPQRFLDNLAVALIALVGLVVHRRHGFRAALIWLLWATWSALAVVMAMRYGLRDPTALTYPLFIVMAGWLLGRRHAYGMLLASAVLAVGMVMAENRGWIASTSPVGSTTLAAVFVAVLVVGSVVSLAIANSARSQHDRVLELIDTLESRVAERTAHLETVNSELQQTVADLKRVQRELVNSEKLASLGAMVAGISHELNTPIGNALTASTTMAHEIEVFVQKAAEPTMKRSTLREFGNTVTGLSELLQRSLDKAAQLISSFKRVAVDRTSERRQTFDLKQTIDQLVLTLRPTLKIAPWEIISAIPPDVMMDSYPGPLEQVLANLVINAHIHAFEGRQQGKVRIFLQPDPDARGATQRATARTIRLCVADDGNGMSEEIAVRAFEPFFTTKLGQGGSGLGLSISHSIVTGILGGTMKVETAPGMGTTFILDIPVVAPYPRDREA